MRSTAGRTAVWVAAACGLGSLLGAEQEGHGFRRHLTQGRLDTPSFYACRVSYLAKLTRREDNRRCAVANLAFLADLVARYSETPAFE